MSHRRSTASSVFHVFSLNPVPYPVLLILAVIFLFLGLQWYVSFESVVESTEENMGWVLMAAPLVILLAVRLLSNVENPERMFFGTSPWDRHRWNYYYRPTEGSSPWGVAAMILLLLVLLQYQSSFLDSWFV